LTNGRVVDIPGEHLLRHVVPGWWLVVDGCCYSARCVQCAARRDAFCFAVSVNPAYQLEQLYNRDSLPYIQEYGLEGVQTMYRGTLRYRGFSATMDALKAIGFFNDDSRQIPATWPQLIQAVIAAPPCRCTRARLATMLANVQC
jgi:hypothetical protein